MKSLMALLLIYTAGNLFAQTRWDLPSSNLDYVNLKESIMKQKIKKCKEGHLHYKNHYSYPKKKKIEVQPDVLGKCFLAAYQNFHKNKESYFKNMEVDKEQYNNLLSYLAGSKDVVYTTGKENKLKKWVMSQADNSITPHSIFEKSLILNNGHLFNTILTIHELLRNEARFYADYIYYNSSWAGLKTFYNKFIDIRGDLEERCDGISGGDHSGSWYRIWGTMIDSAYKVDLNKNECHSVTANGSTMCYMQGCFISTMAEIIKPLYMGEYSEIDDRKSSINMVGYNTMDSIYEHLEDNQFPSKKYYCDESKHLLD